MIKKYMQFQKVTHKIGRIHLNLPSFWMYKNDKKIHAIATSYT
jgi:hypothetical protein